jgi:cytochrome c553
MGVVLRHRVRWIIAAMLASLIAIVAGALLLAWSGIYNIAASRGHLAITEWFLAFGMRNSVERRALLIEVPPLDSPDLITLGAAHFHAGCAYCHGSPGTPTNPVAQRMLPPPPDLSHATSQWKDRELFWIVKHGIKYTGMPAWASQQRDDEVWALVAFLRRLPSLSEPAYRELALGNLTIAPQSGREIATSDGTSAAVSACARCHGSEGRRPASGLVPVLHGQTAEFLTAALRDYAAGKRESGIMQPVASDLAPVSMRRVADFYAGLAPPPALGSGDGVAGEKGRVLAAEGDPGRRIPPCVTCHGPDALAVYPRLAGQNAAYMAGRLRRWRSGFVATSETDAIMAPIARLLNDEQIDQVSAWFSLHTQTVRSGGQGR